MNEKRDAFIRQQNKVVITLCVVCAMALIYPFKAFVPGIPWNALPNDAMEAMPRAIYNALTPEVSSREVDRDSQFDIFFSQFLQRNRHGWTTVYGSYRPGVVIVTDPLRLDYSPEAHRLIALYRVNGGDIQFMKHLSEDEETLLRMELARLGVKID